MIRNGYLLQRGIEERTQGKPTREKQIIEMLYGMIGEGDYANLKKEHDIEFSGETGL